MIFLSLFHGFVQFLFLCFVLIFFFFFFFRSCNIPYKVTWNSWAQAILGPDLPSAGTTVVHHRVWFQDFST
jgi:hypothetical protein